MFLQFKLTKGFTINNLFRHVDCLNWKKFLTTGEAETSAKTSSCLTNLVSTIKIIKKFFNEVVFPQSFEKPKVIYNRCLFFVKR